MQIADNLINLFFPRICLACGRKLLKFEYVICSYCDAQLPQTHFHNRPANPVEILFWGRCEIHAASAYYRYMKEGRVQNLIHNFKYKGFLEVGLHLGEKYGSILSESDRFSDVDIIIPVPLHPKRQQIRGFNQSEVIGRGLETTMTATLSTKHLLRNTNTATQTNKSRWERYKNVDNIFIINNEEELVGKHLLIVDDVITTGSTIEACVNTLNTIKDVRVSVVAIGSAAH